MIFEIAFILRLIAPVYNEDVLKTIGFVRVHQISEVVLSHFEYFAKKKGQGMQGNVLSALQCASLCSLASDRDCSSFEYRPDSKLCYFSSVPAYRWSDSQKYMLKLECPPGSSHVPELNSCYSLVPGDFSDGAARSYCNGRGMHPVVVESRVENVYIAKNIAIPQKCKSASNFLKVRTAGIKNSTWFWKPYSMLIPFNFTNWSLGQPDEKNGFECLQFFNDYSWDDYYCDRSFCVLCELNLQ